MRIFDKLKKQPLLGLTLAIASGYVLAHFVTRSADYFYENELGSNPHSAVILLAGVGLTSLFLYRYGTRLLCFVREHWRPVTASFLVIVFTYLLMAYKAKKREERRQAAHRAYADEYNRRYALFAIEHVGATQEDFLNYEGDPKGLYGYAKILNNMKGDGSLFNPKKFGIASNRKAACESKDSDIDRYYCEKEEDEIRHLAQETRLDEETVRWNFPSVRKRAERAEIAEPMLNRQLVDPSFAAIAYEDEYMKKMADITVLSPELEKALYDEIVLGGRKHPSHSAKVYLDDNGNPVTFDLGKAMPLSGAKEK